MNDLAHKIRNTALELGFEECGIIPVAETAAFAGELRKRAELYPESAEFLSQYERFARIETLYPWARSIVAATTWYGDYALPGELPRLFAKYYLTDHRRDEAAPGLRRCRDFEASLRGFGLRTLTEMDNGVLPERWAAWKAGLGIVRKNNLLYTRRGSWVVVNAWLIDRELELRHKPEIRACPDNCSICQRACPTGALAAPYNVNACKCLSYISTEVGFSKDDKYGRKAGTVIYGCDICQNVCPFNRAAWTGANEFPGLAELAGVVSLEKILDMADAELAGILSARFWYIEPGQAQRWRDNALNAMRNSNDPEYRARLAAAGWL